MKSSVSTDVRSTRSMTKMERNVLSIVTFCYGSVVHLPYQLLAFHLPDLNSVPNTETIVLIHAFKLS